MAIAYNSIAFYTRLSTIKIRTHALFPGVMVSMIVATSAQFLADHYSTPAMLLALLLGIAISVPSDEGKTVEGIGFTSKTLLRFWVALLGVRISVDLIIRLVQQSCPAQNLDPA